MPRPKPVPRPGQASKPGLMENVRTVVCAGLIAVTIRTVAVEPFNIPSGSMIPTLLVGDFLFITKYSYGYSRYSLPFSPDLFAGRILGGLPRRGDVVVFKYPRDNQTDYIKRVIGLPGDHVRMAGGHLLINGMPVPREPDGTFAEREDGGTEEGQVFLEHLPPGPNGPGATHPIMHLPDRGWPGNWPNNTQDYVVPPDHLFCMGDNRDNSQDSRFMDAVGFVPTENLLGRARFVFLSVDARAPLWQVWQWPAEIRWNRILTGIR